MHAIALFATICTMYYSVSGQDFSDVGVRCGAFPVFHSCQGDTRCMRMGKPDSGSRSSGFCVKKLELLCTDIACSAEKPCETGFQCKQWGLNNAPLCVNVKHLSKHGERCTTIYGGSCIDDLVCDSQGIIGFWGTCVKASKK